jgi:trehalose 6-phosphate phosphatase
VTSARISSSVADTQTGFPAPARNWALFLDVDGTMLDIVERPDAVAIPVALRGALQRIFLRNGGALALVSGRRLIDLDRLFTDARFPSAGQHGLERRDALGNVTRLEGVSERIASAAREIENKASGLEGVLVEHKGLTLAVHYRLAPHLQDWVASATRAALARLGDEFRLVQGKMIWEIRPSGKDKGVAITEFMGEAPFAGRIPVFIGDDATDEDGFIVVNAMNGYSVKVGPGASTARWHVQDAQEVRRWLTAFAEYLEQ